MKIILFISLLIIISCSSAKKVSKIENSSDVARFIPDEPEDIQVPTIKHKPRRIK